MPSVAAKSSASATKRPVSSRAEAALPPSLGVAQTAAVYRVDKRLPARAPLAVTNFAQMYKAPVEDIIGAIRHGISAREFKNIANKMHAPIDQVYKSLGVPKSTIERKALDDDALTSSQSELALGLARLIGQVEDIVNESGDPEGFDAASWVWNWLNQPMPALGGKLPATYMDTVEGQRYISNLISMAQSGAYA